MFWVLAFLFPIGYALQNVLMLHYVRKHDAASMGMYRGFSLGISFLPVLFFMATTADFSQTLQYWPKIALASALVGATVIISFYVLKHLPLGVFTAASSSLKIILTALFGLYFFQEILNLWQMVFIGVIIVGVVFLKLQKHHAAHLQYKCPKILFGLLFLQSLTLSLGVILIADVARQANPWVAGYLWEIGIGLTAMIYALARPWWGGKGIEKISLKQFGGVLLCASPTVLGTGAFFLASTMGPVGILSAIGTLEIIIGTLLAWWWYHERLNLKQWSAIFVVILGIVGLRLFS